MTSQGWGSEPLPESGATTPRWDSSGWEDDQASGLTGWEAGATAAYQPPAPTPVTGLRFALAAASLGVVIGLALAFLVDRPTPLTAAMAVVAWLLAGIVPVLSVAGYQRIELRRAASIYYRPDPSAAPLRTAALALGVVGVVLNSLHFSEWLARL